MSYDVETCVKRGISKEIGCKAPWDTWSPTSAKVCNSLENLEKYLNMEKKILESEKRIIFNISNCLLGLHKMRFISNNDPKKMGSMVQN